MHVIKLKVCQFAVFGYSSGYKKFKAKPFHCMLSFKFLGILLLLDPTAHLHLSPFFQWNVQTRTACSGKTPTRVFYLVERPPTPQLKLE